MIAYPIGDNDGSMIGLVDLVEQRALYWDDAMRPTEPRLSSVPAARFDNTHRLRDQLIAASAAFNFCSMRLSTCCRRRAIALRCAISIRNVLTMSAGQTPSAVGGVGI